MHSRFIRLQFLAASCIVALATTHSASAASLFDGKTLTGWEGDLKWWRVEDSLITGGSRTEKVPRNLFLATTRSFENFDLRLQLKLTGDPKTGLINSGVQIRSVRLPGTTEMYGYQVDAGDGWWGKLYDESRRKKVIAESLNSDAVSAAVKAGDWNEYHIRTEGPRIRSWINGVPAVDYTETESNIPQDGYIGIQIHGGGIALVQVKDVVIEELSPTPNAPTWDKVGRPKAPEPAPAQKAPATKAPELKADTKTPLSLPGRDISYNAITTGPLSPEEERRSFTLPDGFEIELVAAESEGLGKFITVAWDAHMRIWTMTALEYPVDGNEQKAASDALFARGGRDKVIVFDDPYGGPARGPPKPRIFVEGLVMPLGVQPYKNGVYVQYGSDIRFYSDSKNTGHADSHEVILTGFGTQDSHLFPHEFLRQPGGWMFVAQGAFNYSKVRRPDDRPFAEGAMEFSFNQCKLARFQLDGSRWENLSAGPQNIWGLVTSREGETFMQEANDMGYPVIPYEPGIHVRTSSKEKLRPYQPLMPPPLNPAQMGGTGLSGLALAEDRDGFFHRVGATIGSDAKVFYLANPITGTVQIVKATPDADGYHFEKLPDFITTTDHWFRPVAVHFGPDGGLYIVDWYNKIISHNEVPRDHPDRDKTRGRIWRVRHREQPRVVPPDLTKLDDRALLAQLGGPSALVSRLAWLEIIDRKADALAPELRRIAADASVPADRRLGALWALEGLQPVPTDLLQTLASAPAATLRHEAARVAGAQPRTEAEFLAIATPLIQDSQPSVRAAIGDALRRVPNASVRVMSLAARLGAESMSEGTEFARYHREFERYLARWAMELNPRSTAALLSSPEGKALPLENRVLATLALGGKESALGLCGLAPSLQRPLAEEEVRTLAAHFAEPAVRETLDHALARTESRASVLRALLSLRLSLDTTTMTPALTTAASALLASRVAADVALGAEVAGAFKLAGSATELVTELKMNSAASPLPPPALAALRALREMGLGPTDLFAQLARAAKESVVRDEALAALAASASTDAAPQLMKLLPQLSVNQRNLAMERLAGTPAGSSVLMEGLRSKLIVPADLGVGTVEKLRLLLPGDPLVAARWQELGGDTQRALRLPGGADDFPATQIALAGPFTIECWLKLDPEINNRDGLIGASGQFDLNFYDGRFRVWLVEANDVVVAKKKAVPGVWTHYAVSRDAAGVFRLFINGELDATSTSNNTSTFTGLNIGRSRVSPVGGVTAGWLAEYRVWNAARSPEEIRENFDRTFSGTMGDVRPPHLTHRLGGATWGPLNGNAHVEIAEDAPALLTDAQAVAQAKKFARFRVLAETPGQPARGRELFTSVCLACHQQGGKGGQIAPVLDGVGLTGVEALLRNILTPSAAMESAYRIFRVVMNDGRIQEGFLVEDNTAAVVLRMPGAEDRRIPRQEIRTAAFLPRSLMPEGLLENMTADQVSDLFSYLKTLK